MCNYGQYVRNEGKLEGRLEGKLEGRFEGIKETTLLSIKNVMKNFNVDALMAMKSLEIDENEFPMYLEMMKEVQSQ